MSRVLAVDDLRLLADLRETALGRSGVELRVARTRAALLEEFRASSPDVVLLSDGDGCPEPCSAARGLRREPAGRRPVVMFVGSYIHRDHARAAGIDLFVPRHAGRVLLGEALARATSVSARRTRRWPVDLAWSAETDRGRLSGRCVDLSLGGCFVVSDGAPLELQDGETVVRLDLGDRVVSVTSRLARRGSGRDGAAGTAFAFRASDAAGVGALSRAVRDAAERRGATGEGAR